MIIHWKHLKHIFTLLFKGKSLKSFHFAGGNLRFKLCFKSASFMHPPARLYTILISLLDLLEYPNKDIINPNVDFCLA